MNIFFLEFRDPLFSVIIFFALVFIITFLSYWWGRYRRREDYKHLDRFLKQFRSPPSQKELQVLIGKGELSEKSWLLLAHSYSKSGDYEKSIEIYNEVLKSSIKHNYRDTMFLLGQTYFKAGFLERAKQIFLEILKNNPRTPQALSALLLVYEHMRDYAAALEVLEPLSELNRDVTLDCNYLKVLNLLNDVKLAPQEKATELLKVYQSSSQLAYTVFEYLFRVDAKLAWKNFDSSRCEQLTDILWQLDKKDLDLDIITHNGYLRELYTARGDMKLATRSDIFEFDILINLNSNSNATLSFEYVCDSCKQVYPFAFGRCSCCHTIDKSRVEISLVKDYRRDFAQGANSFQ